MNPNSRQIWRVIAGWLALGVCLAQVPAINGEHTPTFGVTVVAPFGFCGRVYELPEVPQLPAPARVSQPGLGDIGAGLNCSSRLPEFQRLRSAGSIYTTRLNIPARDFRAGFPGVTGRFEWFAIDYTARFWIDKPGKYSFLLMSDDGSILYVDERRIIDNDCVHAPLSVGGSARLEGGIHDMRVSYFQGPRWQVALVLYIKPPGEKFRVFDTDEFRPPPNPADWKYPNPANLDAPLDPCTAERRPRKLVVRP